uniref:DNA-directed DNA polymerase n=1 Tax=Rhizoctonia solani TaxID=456999 RepID=A0A8E8L7R4_9AGAM|nr:DNA polymerase [Rhizoctonia solani]
MPTGVYQHVVGPIDITNPNLIAFVKAKITAPENLKVPLLPVRINGKMITGAGTWDGMYFSKELHYALSLGYKIEAYEAYIFEGRLVFNEFIENIYNERLKFPKSDPMNYICKLIMNSTYGRFGMAPILTDVKVFNRNDEHNYMDGTEFLDITNINENLVMVTSNTVENINLDIKNPNNNLQISLPIAIATTSYARICIHEYKQAAAEQGILLYSDTDSIRCSAPLPDELLGNGLGQLNWKVFLL